MVGLLSTFILGITVQHLLVFSVESSQVTKDICVCLMLIFVLGIVL